MIKNNVVTRSLYILSFICILSSLFCSTQHAGGSEIGNPRVVIGSVSDSAGHGIHNVTLYLVDPLEKNPGNLNPDSLYHVVSGAEGMYCFSGIYAGIYNLIGIDSEKTGMFLRSIEITENDEVLENDTVRFGVDTIEAPATIVVSINDCADKDTALVFIPGTVFQIMADTCGEYLLRCPASRIDVAVCKKDTLYMEGEHIEVASGQWVDLTGKTYDVPTPKIISGLISGMVGRVYFFDAGRITLGPNHPVEYRFDWGDSFSDWNLSSQRGHAWDMSGSYLVRVQSRSVRDTSSLSEWSEGVPVSITGASN